jgi:hypothetical protein
MRRITCSGPSHFQRRKRRNEVFNHGFRGVHGWERIRSGKAESWPGRIIRAESEGALTAEGEADHAETEITVTKSQSVTTGYYP